MINPYIRLMRLDKPIGIYLLWYPTAWALWLANKGMPAYSTLLLFILGTIIMRSAGCVINDLADMKFDKHVTRTQLRPLATGELTPRQAVLLIVVLLSAALLILLNLPSDCIKYAVIALFLTAIYPLCKRFINAPQFILGLAFSMGIPMAYAASNQIFNQTGFLLFIINTLWILAYDTLYAMADKPDDLLIGVKSTAVYFGKFDNVMVGIFQIIMHALWVLCAYNLHLSVLFYVFWGGAGVILLWQHWIIRNRTIQTCMRAFLFNNYYGALMWVAIILGLSKWVIFK